MASIRKRTKGWQVQIRRDGYRHLSKSFVKRSDAEKWARDIEAKMDLGAYQDTSEARRRLLSDIIDEYIRKILPTKKATKCELSRCKLIQKHLGHLSLASLRASHLAQYRDSRITKVSSQSVRHELSLVGRILNVAIKEWDIYLPYGNPVSKLKLPNYSKGRERRLESGEIERLLHALSHTYTVQAIVQFVLETGMRRSEICNMQWDYIDLAKSTLHIPDTKNGTSRKIPLSRKAQEILKGLPRRFDGLVFKISSDSITQAFERACKRGNITDLRFHDLRHEATSRLFEKGLSVMEVASITGHRDLRILQRYTHLRAEDLVKKLG